MLGLVPATLGSVCVKRRRRSSAVHCHLRGITLGGGTVAAADSQQQQPTTKVDGKALLGVRAIIPGVTRSGVTGMAADLAKLKDVRGKYKKLTTGAPFGH